MRLNGAYFSFEVPDEWQENGEEGIVIAAADKSIYRFIPNLVLRESRIKENSPDILASISQSNLAGLSRQYHGAYIFHVEALPDHSAHPGPPERRRLWGISPGKLSDGSWVTLLMIQDLLVVGDAVAELTATLPLAAWQRESPYEAFLMSLQPLPVEQQGVLHTTVDVAPATLDEWATERDKAPREALAVQVKPDLAPPWATISLTKADFDAFERMARGHVRFRADPSEIVDRRLMAANLFDELGKPTEIGLWIRKIMLRGNSWKAEKAMQYPASFRVWAMGNSSLIVTTSPDAGAGLMQCSIEYCPTEDIGRHLLVWSGLQPSWAMGGVIGS